MDRQGLPNRPRLLGVLLGLDNEKYAMNFCVKLIYLGHDARLLCDFSQKPFILTAI